MNIRIRCSLNIRVQEPTELSEIDILSTRRHIRKRKAINSIGWQRIPDSRKAATAT